MKHVSKKACHSRATVRLLQSDLLSHLTDLTDLLARLHLRRSDPRAAIGPRDGEVGASVGLEQYRGAAASSVRGVGPSGGLVVA